MLSKISVILFSLFVSSALPAADLVPDDIRYMLEDLYGPDKTNWPIIKQADLNKDGFTDWIAEKENCKGKEKCPVEIFVCIPGKKGKCSEYCYNEVKTHEMIKEKISAKKCEATC